MLSTGAIVGISIGCGIAVIIIIFLLVYFLIIKKMGHKSQQKKIMDKFRSLTDILVNDCNSRLSRIKYIADHNGPGFEDKYEQLSEEYKTISKDGRENASQAVSAVTSMVNSKETRGLKRVENDAFKSLNAFEADINKLTADINNTLADDDSYHAMILESKSRLRDFRTMCSEHEVELRPIKDTLSRLFTGFEEYFNQYECYLDRADYVSAKKLLDQINKVLDALGKYGYELHSLIPLCDQVLPMKIAEVKKNVEDAESEKLPLPDKNVKSEIANMVMTLKKTDDDFKSLRLAGIKERLDKMLSRIDEINATIVKERTDRDSFKERHKDINKPFLEIETKYSNYVERLKIIKKNFIVPESVENELNILGDSIEDLGRTIREIDNSVSNQSSPTPYSELLARQKQTEDYNEKIELGFQSFSTEINNMMAKSDEIYNDIAASYEKLCNKRLEIIQIDVVPYTKRSLKKYNDLVAQLQEIENIFYRKPIDMELLIKKYEKFISERDEFFGAVSRDKVMATKAEIEIVYSNKYRASFQTIHEETSKAEQAFLSGDFTNSFNLVNGVLTKENVLDMEQSETSAN